MVQEVQGKNILPARDYGDFKFILPEGQVPMDPHETMLQMKVKMLGFTSYDYLLAIGDPVAIAMACSIASLITGGKFNLLKWDRQQRIYHPWRIQL